MRELGAKMREFGLFCGNLGGVGRGGVPVSAIFVRNAFWSVFMVFMVFWGFSRPKKGSEAKKEPTGCS